MSGEAQLTIALVAFFVFALVSGAATRKWLTAPLLIVAFGLFAGSAGVGWIVADPGGETISRLGEATLVVVLFADASRIQLGALRREAGLPLRLLGIGMPVTILLGTLLARWLFPQWSWWEAALLASVLAPTDAALGQPVVSNASVPQRIRQALNVESGLNDGIALPVVLVFLALASTPDADGGAWLGFWVKQITLGPAVGVLVGGLGGYLLRIASERGLALPEFTAIGGLLLAALCFLLAGEVGGNGFMAAFAGGAAFGGTAGAAGGPVHRFLETEGQLLMLAVFLLLGCALAGPALHRATGPAIAYAALSLTLIRGLPVALSLLGADTQRWTTVFLGWFGPRGLASILFGLLLVEEEGGIAAGEEIFAVVILTVLGSVLLHGVTATWGANAYGAWASRQDDAPEHRAVTDHRTR